jgi:ribosomal protein S12 methylthiotransferase
MTHKKLKNRLKIGLISLGCPKNLADTEALAADITKKIGAILTDVENADIVLLNTCGFLKAARNEAHAHLTKLHSKKVVILGCMSSLFKESDLKKKPQVFAIVSGAAYKRLPEILLAAADGKKTFAVSAEPEKFENPAGKLLLAGTAYAYIKIAEGCSRTCSYCLIPQLRGKYRSRPMEDILAEAKTLIESGIKELILVAQDCGLYGVDLYKKPTLPTLLSALTKIPGDFWIRILYIYPETVTTELLSVMKSSKKICKYLDIPLQHGDSEILEKMNRPKNVQKTLEKIAKIRSTIPDITLRTSLIVGFPGETEKSFKNLLNFVKKINFNHAGVFEYSREKGTPAYSLPNQILRAQKRTRRKKLMLLQQGISKKNMRALAYPALAAVRAHKSSKKNLRVLIESYDKTQKLYIGRSEHFAPEIDGIIFIKSLRNLPIHSFQEVRLTSSNPYDLFGEAL